GSQVTAFEVHKQSGLCVRVKGASGEEVLFGRQVLSTIPISLLARLIRPSLPIPVLESANSLRFRSMILVYLVLETEQFTEFDAHYFPDAEIGITRLSESKNYGLAPLPGRTVLCAELPCFQDEAVWSANEEE